MSKARYIFRMDDACPWMHHKNWNQLEEIFDQYGIRPIVAIVPSCRDEELLVNSENTSFWTQALAWQKKGWVIALHGFDHVYLGKKCGLVPLNRKTEFAGQPEDVQRKKIRDGWAILKGKQLEPTIWIAPAHTFDRVTLQCLLEETTIRTVSDGLSRTPFKRFGFTWVPQQIWTPRACPSGVWTICLHPNTMGPDMLVCVEAFLKKHHSQVTSIVDLNEVVRSWSLADGLFEKLFLIAKLVKRIASWLKMRGGSH